MQESVNDIVSWPSPVLRADGAAAEITLAVFPFENLSTGGDFDIFCKSFCIDLITELSRFKQFQIIAYQTVSDVSIAQAAHADEVLQQKLPVDYWIQGSFRSDGDRIRVNAHLIEMRSHKILWANRFEGVSADLMALQDELLYEVVASLQQQLNYNLLARIRNKPRTNLKAYECWLYGLDELKNGTLESDLKAREYFQQAIRIDPSYSLAYSGMSLTYFNEWSCQLWERWELSQNGALEWAEKAIELDEQNYVASYVLGRILLYQGAFQTAEHYVRHSLRLNPNDPENLVQVAFSLNFLGYPEEALRLYKKASRLNPVGSDYYFSVGLAIYYELGELDHALALIRPMNQAPYVDSQLYCAAVWHQAGDAAKVNACLQNFLESYRRRINGDRPCTLAEAIDWAIKVNPYRAGSKMLAYWQSIAGDGGVASHAHRGEAAPLTSRDNVFREETGWWIIDFEGTQVRLPSVKGFKDLQKLVLKPGESFHCAELMDAVLVESGTPLLDEKARNSYRRKIQALQQEMEDAEETGHDERLMKLTAEYDQLVEYLSGALGLQGKVRQSGGTLEKARSAVTWRIRSAISKIEKEHPVLGKHLANAVKTGTFCGYHPERPTVWTA